MQLQLINVSLLLQNQVTLVQNLFAILEDFSKKHNTHIIIILIVKIE